MKKRMISMILAGALVLSTCACGTTEVAESETKQSEVAVSVETASQPTEVEEKPMYPLVDEPITLKGLVVGADNAVREDRIAWNLMGEVTGIYVEWVNIDKEALNTYLAAGDLPDLIHVKLDNAIINDYGVAGGKLVNFNDYLEYMPNMVKTFEDFPLAQGYCTEVDGGIYSLPCVEVSATVVSARPHVRTDVLKAANVEVPKTVEDFRQALIDLKAYDPEISWIPYVTQSQEETDWQPMMFAAFGELTSLNFEDDGTGKVIYNPTSEQYKRYATFMHELYEEELIHPEFLTLDPNTRLDLAKRGKLAFIDSAQANSLTLADFPSGEWELGCVAPLTSEYDSTQEILGKLTVSALGMSVSADCEYIEEVCKMLDIFYATEEVVEGTGLYGMTFAYGVEGVDWYPNEDGKTYELIAPKEYDGNVTLYRMQNVKFGNTGTGRNTALSELVTSTVGNSQARQLGFVQDVKPYMSDLYFPEAALKFTEEEQMVIDNLRTTIREYETEMLGKFIIGTVDIETGWDSYCKEIEKMGINDLLKVYQDAYDRWLGK